MSNFNLVQKKNNRKGEKYMTEVTKKTCLECLNFLEEHAMEPVEDYDYEENLTIDYEKISPNYLKSYIKPLEKVIHEYFDFPTIISKLINGDFELIPLKFDDIKKGMWVWDNANKECRKVEGKAKKDRIRFHTNDDTEYIDELYVENRFLKIEFNI